MHEGGALNGVLHAGLQTNNCLLRREGRQLIYDLSTQHRNCLLLNYAIQRILKAGHEDEVASVGSSLASYFGVFHRLMANRLKEVPQADGPRLEKLAAELKVSDIASSTWIITPHQGGDSDVTALPSCTRGKSCLQDVILPSAYLPQTHHSLSPSWTSHPVIKG